MYSKLSTFNPSKIDFLDILNLKKHNKIIETIEQVTKLALVSKPRQSLIADKCVRIFHPVFTGNSSLTKDIKRKQKEGLMRNFSKYVDHFLESLSSNTNVIAPIASSLLILISEHCEDMCKNTQKMCISIIISIANNCYADLIKKWNVHVYSVLNPIGHRGIQQSLLPKGCY